jgi:hypothetical protein
VTCGPWVIQLFTKQIFQSPPMGSFTTSHAVTYDIGDGSGSGGGFTPAGAPSSKAYADVAVTDGDIDTAFEAGDSSSFFTFAVNYIGTMVIDEITWPVFQYRANADFKSVLMDQVPVVISGAAAVNFGATVNDPCFAAGTQITTAERAQWRSNGSAICVTPLRFRSYESLPVHLAATSPIATSPIAT